MLYGNGQKYDLKTMTQKDILKWIAQTRSSETTPFAGKLETELGITRDQMLKIYGMITKIGYDTKSRSYLFKQCAGLLYGK